MTERYRLEARIGRTSKVTYHGSLSDAAEEFRQLRATTPDVWLGAKVVHEVSAYGDRDQLVGAEFGVDVRITETYEISPDDRDPTKMVITRAGGAMAPMDESQSRVRGADVADGDRPRPPPGGAGDRRPAAVRVSGMPMDALTRIERHVTQLKWLAAANLAITFGGFVLVLWKLVGMH